MDHTGQHRAAGVERAVQIDGHHPPPVLVGGVGEQLDLRDARIADEHLQTAEFLLGPGNGGAHLGGVARVGPDGKIEAAGVDFFGLTAHGVGGIGVGIVRKGDVIACPGKGQHRRRTDAAAAAGDENVICHGKTSIHCPLACLPLGGRCPEGGGAPSQRGPRKKALFLFPFFPQHHKKILQQGLRLVLQQARFYDRMVVERQGEQIGQATAAARLGVACAVDDPL